MYINRWFRKTSSLVRQMKTKQDTRHSFGSSTTGPEDVPEQDAISSGFDGIGELLPASSMTGDISNTSLEVSPAFVFGPDDRERVGSTTSYPFSAVGRMVSYWPDGTSSTCSGAIISPYHVLTAGHCVYSEEKGGWADRIEVMLGSVRGRAGNHFPTLPFGTGLATFTASGYWVIGPCPG